MPRFASVTEVTDRLAEVGYLVDEQIATSVFLATALGKPILVEGPAGVGKTTLAKATAAATGAALIRLQCYEGVDESRALYEWNYKKQLLRIQAASGDEVWSATQDEIFTEEFLLPRPLLQAIRRAEPTVLLIDEIDKADVELEGMLLELLSDFQVTIPELGTITAQRQPMVVITSNASRELSEALRRRCLYLHIGYPDAELEKRIILTRLPAAAADLADQVVRLVRLMRSMDLRKPPSIAESIDWARTLVALEVSEVEGGVLTRTLGAVLKNQSDQQAALSRLLPAAQPRD
jgi:MoxR-like ATPase